MRICLLCTHRQSPSGIHTHTLCHYTTLFRSRHYRSYKREFGRIAPNVIARDFESDKHNKSLGQFRLDGIPPAPRGIPQVEVTFDIDANGIVNVSAKDLGTGKEQHITITAGSNMSDDEIDKAVKEAAEFEAQDKKKKEAIETRNDADAFVFQTEKALTEVGDKISDSDKSQVQADLDAVKAILDRTKDQEMNDNDLDELKVAKEKLTNSAQSLFTKMYESMQGAAGTDGPMPDMGAEAPSGAPDDDIIDGDFREV